MPLLGARACFFFLTGFALVLTPEGMALEVGGARVCVGKALRERVWYRVWASADPDQPGKIKPVPIPDEIVACLPDPAGATRVAP